MSKLKITSFVTLTTLFGYICFTPKLTVALLSAVVGTLLLAAGASVINHIQEYKIDALMTRTKNRPIPSGKITVTSAGIISVILIAFGSLILLSIGLVPLILGLLNIFWYNIIYTPLKKISPIAIIPGSMVGAIPPAIGWTSAGGYLFDPQILVISFFFFIWQIPHFWLLLLFLGKEYEQAGYPTLTKLFDIKQLSRITFVWITATVVASLLIPFFGIVKNHLVYFILLFAGVWLTWNASKFLIDRDQKMNFTFAFREINLFALIVMLIITFDQILFLF
ncbi:MAG: protoheme IX farnesyltransferase [Ignavibacteriaceae bacterium]|nr:protoheme IX farnesyltransferase [Ignavibacteriaceae bacterium]